MAWSTRQLAELAGTSLRAVRHYHEVGLLAEPERRANGYKQYGVSHLVRLLRIKRLIDLGLSLSQIAELGDADEHPAEALRTLDAELAATIERLRRARLEIALILKDTAPTDLPPELARTAIDQNTSAADRGLLAVLSQIIDPQEFGDFLEHYEDVPRAAVTDEFDNLPADADERTRQDLADRLSAHHRQLLADRPDMRDLIAISPRGTEFASEMLARAVVDLYNPAQIDVMTRLKI